MFKFPKAILVSMLIAASGLAAAQEADKFPGVGRNATPKEVAAWDIDVRPDFKGLPSGSGSVAAGQDIWEGKCAQCQGNQLPRSNHFHEGCDTINGLGFHQPRDALERTQVIINRRCLRGHSVHVELERHRAGQLHFV
jgi:hypothetical protein